MAIAKKYGFVKEFNGKVKSEVALLPNCVTEDELVGRMDLRHLDFVTIDPGTCKDMDDAIYIEKTKNGYRLITAIADVAYYVNKNSEIDKEAYKRGTSCYLGDGVYPMLPEELSNDMCSLNENVDRLVRLTIMNLDNNGKVLDYELVPGVIKSRHKLSYKNADEIHFNKNNANVIYSDIKEKIDMMFTVSDLLTNQRKQRGSLFINRQEVDYGLDETKTEVTELHNHNDYVSTKIIESFMLITNEVVAKYFKDNNLDTLFRVHEAPTPASLKEFNAILKQFNLPGVTDNPKSYQAIAEKIKGNPYEEFLTIALLHSMQKASYKPENSGHFGIAAQYYVHFTSPIRRYPDLIVHRILNAFQKGLKYRPTVEELDLLGEHLSKKEQDAKDAEVESNEFMNILWAKNHENEVFKGKILRIFKNEVIVKSGLMEFKMPLTTLLNGKSGFKVNETQTAIKNSKTGEIIKIADEVIFRIDSVSTTDKYIRLSLEEKTQINQNTNSLKVKQDNQIEK